MKPNPKFLAQSPEFWANVKLISQKLGYTERATKQIKIPALTDIVTSYERDGLAATALINNGLPTQFGQTLLDYFAYRADRLNNYVEPLLMNVSQARQVFEELHTQYNPRCVIPMNKQKGEKRSPAYFTSIINILIEVYSQGYTVNYTAPHFLDRILAFSDLLDEACILYFSFFPFVPDSRSLIA
jgi:hypothetical protein